MRSHPHAPRSSFLNDACDDDDGAGASARAPRRAARARAPLVAVHSRDDDAGTPRPAAALGRRVRALSVAAAGQAKMCEPGQTLPDATLIEKHKPVRIHDIFKGSIFAM